MLPRQYHEKIYLYSLILLAVSFPLSIFATSLFQFFLVINWLAEGRFREKWVRFREDRALWFFLALFFIHLVGLIWSSDMIFGLKDIRIKLPLLALPVIIGTSAPLERRQVDSILHGFVIAIFLATGASMLALSGILGIEINDFRDISLFISYIRFSLLIVLANIIIIYFLFFSKEKLSPFLRYFYYFNLFWFSFFLIILKSMSGVVIYIFIIYFILIRLTFRIREPVIRFMVFVFALIIPLISIAYVGHAVKRFYTVEVISPEDIDEKSVEGTPYLNLPDRKEIENGHYVWMYVCKPELEREWNRVSDIDYHGKTKNGNNIEITLIRYMTSKGLRKDAAGFRKLTPEDIEAVEKGIANCIYLNRFSLYPRIYEIIWEFYRYNIGHSPNQKSIVQRIFYLKAGWQIAVDHVWLGVGTGGSRTAFNKYYTSTDSPLDTKWRKRAHNQYLTFFLVFGIFGFMICMTSIFVPIFINHRWKSYMVVMLMIIICLSMLNEDTLETSAGVTPFALFYSLFVFGPKYLWFKNG